MKPRRPSKQRALQGSKAAASPILTAQLAKSREQVKTAQARAQRRASAANPRPMRTRSPRLLKLAAQCMADGRLLAPDRDNARFYVQEALALDPNNAPGKSHGVCSSSRLLGDARSAIDRRDFALAASLIEGAEGIAACGGHRVGTTPARQVRASKRRGTPGLSCCETRTNGCSGSADRTGKRQRQILPAQTAPAGSGQSRAGRRHAGFRHRASSPRRGAR